MATYIQGIQTSVGVVKYDYNALGNLPESDMTLTKQGAFADALVVGRKFTQLGADVDKLKESMTAVQQAVSDLKASDASTATAIEQINTSLLEATNSIETMQNDISTLQGNITTLTKNTTEIKNSADTANSSVTALQKTIESLQARIETLEKAQTK